VSRLRRLKLVFVAIGMIGAGVAVVTENQQLTWAAIAFLAAALAIRLIDKDRPTGA
jgi:lipid-binding SYLF domain-containing protein